MSVETSKASETAHGLVQAVRGSTESTRAQGVYKMACYDKDGNLKWEEEFPNLVVNVGLQDMNTQYFNGSSYTAAWYLGLIIGPASSTNFAATDTMSSHAGWTESVSYSNATRPGCSFGSATSANPSVISNTLSPATFNMNASVKIAGAFLTNNSTKGGTTGILFSAADFQAPGDRDVVNGDILTVTYTFNLTA
jgi:hypothetical protein